MKYVRKINWDTENHHGLYNHLKNLIRREKMEQQISNYPVVIEFPIAWGDMDAFQHVNNVIYLRYFESARASYLEKLDYFGFMKKTGFGPILASIQCKFKNPLTYPDKVKVGVRVSILEKERFFMEHIVISHKLEKIAALGEGTMVSFDYNLNKKVPIPDEMRMRIIELEKSVNHEFQS